jgi:hypothetical protein
MILMSEMLLPTTKEARVARKLKFDKLIAGIITQIGQQVAQGVADGIARSGLLKKLAATTRGFGRKGSRRGRSRSGSGKIKTCSKPGCRAPSRAKGLCSRHYQQLRYAQQHGIKVKARVRKAIKKTPGKSAAMKANRKVRPAPRNRKTAKNQTRGTGTCREKGCKAPVYAQGLCGKHFMAWVRSKRKKTG